MANRRQNRGQKCPGSREIYRLAGQNTETHVKPLRIELMAQRGH